MRSVVILSLIALGACASGGAPEQTARPAAIFSSAETGTLMGEQPHSARTDVEAPPPTVWIVAKAVYAELGIPTTTENTTTHQIGNMNFFKTRTLAGKSMTAFVDCGSGMDGPKAASYRIYMSLITDVTTNGKGGTTIQTLFVPSGQDMGGSSSDRISCGSSGALETLINQRIAVLIAK